MIRKRRRSISSSSSAHSRHSASPFLQTTPTEGKCKVCACEDQPINRLARCAKCADAYHQSCHVPSLTKSILEEAGEGWTCRKCRILAVDERQRKKQDDGVAESVTGSERQSLGASGIDTVPKARVLAVRKKTHDEKVLEQVTSTNRSSHKNFLQRHRDYLQRWKSPKGNLDEFPPVDESKQPDSAERETAKWVKPLRITAQGESEASAKPKLPLVSKIKNAKVAVKSASKYVIPMPSPRSTSSPEIARSAVKSSSKTPSESPAPAPTGSNVTEDEVTFQEASKVEAVPAVKPPPKKAIPASQPSDSSQQLSPALTLIEPDSPPVVRPAKRVNSKRALVISDSEEEHPSQAKRAKVTPSPRAAMKTASSVYPPLTNPTPLRLPEAPIALPPKSKEAAKKLSSRVAKKSGIVKSRSSETPDPTIAKLGPAVKPAPPSVPRSPVSPALTTAIRHVLSQSPLPSTRPTSPGASQRYSLQLIMTSSSSKTIVDRTTPSEVSTPLFSSPYPPVASMRAPARPTASTSSSSSSIAPGLRKRSQKRDNFDILSLVPEAAVAVLEDGKLAFREGTVDLRTGQLKRGARKYKVGRITPSGDII